VSVKATDPSPLITECPNCQTRFRVGESQLQMAHGRVRCGACLAVFAGVDHLLFDESAPRPELPSDADELESVLAELDVPPATQSSTLAEKGADLTATPNTKTDTKTDTNAPATTNAEAAKQSNQQAPQTASETAPQTAPETTDENVDWTSVSVDTQEIGGKGAREGAPAFETDDLELGEEAQLAANGPERESPRASISDALSNEEALRWWLEDELPGAADSGLVDAELNGEEMMVQLSKLDAVQEEELDLRALIGPSGDKSNARALEEMFNEDLDEEQNQDDGLADEEVEKPDSDNTAEEPVDSPANDNLEPAGEEPEPLMSRAMENGTIAAAAARMTTSPQRTEKPVATQPPPAKTKAGSFALVESPHQPVASDQSGSAKPAKLTKEADIWESKEFPETPPELLADISQEMAAAGQAAPIEEPSILERAKDLIDGFLGHAMALRVATALAFVLLTGQILYWQFAEWSKTETMRPLYTGLCSVLGCELPARRSLRDLQSRKLAVRSHPEIEGALLVDALIINEANFEQPFPIIELQFMDMAQDVVGAYRLEPITYLDGELSGSNALMAVRTPVHIDIDIPDPGPKAVNYQLQFR